MAEGDVVAEMQRHVDEINNMVARSKLRTAVKSAFLVTKVGLNVAPAAAALLGLPIPPTQAISIGNATVLMGENVVDRSLADGEIPPDNPAAMFYSARQELVQREFERLFEFG